MTPKMFAKLDEKIRREAYRAAFNATYTLYVDASGNVGFEPNTLSYEELLDRRWNEEGAAS